MGPFFCSSIMLSNYYRHFSPLARYYCILARVGLRMRSFRSWYIGTHFIASVFSPDLFFMLCGILIFLFFCY